MSKQRDFVAAGAILVVSFGVIAASPGVRERYEIRPEIAIGEYRSDAARAIDAYERLMERHMDLMEGELAQVLVNAEVTARRLESIDRRLGRIEAALGIVERPVVEAAEGDVNEPAEE